jgi:5'-nucleotidase
MKSLRLALAFPVVGSLLAALAPAGCGDSGAGGGGAGGGTSGDRHLVVLFTSDEHSHLFGFSPELDDYPAPTTAGAGSLKGGAARRAVLIARERKAASDAGKDSILVSAGDNQMGCLPHVAFETRSIDYVTMKALGYDVTTFGNHEFDFGPKALAASIEAAKGNGGLPPIVSSNIHFSDADPADDALAGEYSTDPATDAAVHPYRVLTTANGLKIGVLGYVGINAAHVAPNKTPVKFSVQSGDAKTDGDVQAGLPSLYADIQPVVDKLRNEEKVDLVIALSHSGVNDTTSQAGIDAGEDTQVCDNVSGIDFIVSGHAHNHDPRPMQRTNKATGKPCLVLNGGSFGEELGRVEFTIPKDPAKGVTWDMASQALLPIDDTTVPDPAMATTVQGYVGAIEGAGAGGSTLATLLSHALGTSVSDDVNTPGDLYFHPIANTSFDVTDTHALVYLSADSMLAAADEWAAANGNVTTDLAVESAGVIRSTLKKGKTGTIAAADAFNVVPLGSSPVDGSIGYPLIRGYVTLFELKGVAEFALGRDPQNSDYDLGFAGLEIEYDKTRPPAQKLADLFDATKGQVMKIRVDTDHSDGYEQFDKLLYDRDAMVGDLQSTVSFVTSSYIGQFASDAGVTIRDSMGMPLTVSQAIIERTDASEIKAVESFMGFLHAAPGGTLPALYDVTSSSYTKRWVCTAGC